MALRSREQYFEQAEVFVRHLSSPKVASVFRQSESRAEVKRGVQPGRRFRRLARDEATGKHAPRQTPSHADGRQNVHVAAVPAGLSLPASGSRPLFVLQLLTNQEANLEFAL